MDTWLFNIIVIFALIVPTIQLVAFALVAFWGLRLYRQILSDMTELVDKLGVAFIEDRQTYRMIGDLIQEERKNARRD